jgi:hypothetical protein
MPSVPCRKITRHVKEVYEYERDISYAKLDFFRQVSPASLVGVSVDDCQRALVDESGMIRNQMGMENRSDMVAVQGSPCAPTLQE